MPDAVYADPSERLPWLTSAMPAKPRRRRSALPLVVFLLAVAALAFGAWSLIERRGAPAPVLATPERTVALPPPKIAAEPAEAQPQAPSVSERDALRPVAAEPAVTARPKRRATKPALRRTGAKSARPAAPAAVPAYDPRAWNSGVRGRIIQLGAFRTSAQANGEWKRVYYRYPLLRPLPPRVVKSKIRGRTYYRLQLGTFSQAHSELLCQRLRATGEGCIVLGLRRR